MSPGERVDGAASAPELTVVIVHHGDRGLLARCLERLAELSSEVRFETVVVDNGPSPAPPPRVPGRWPLRWVCNSTNLGFAAAANRGAALARAPLILFLNNDVVVGRGVLRALSNLLQADPGLAVVAPATVAPAAEGGARDPRRRFLGPLSQAAGLLGIGDARRPGGGAVDREQAGPDRGAFEVVGPYWLEACALLVRRAVLRSVGGFDEGYFFYEEDEDLCWRLRRHGHRLAVCPGLHVEHEGQASARRAGDWPLRELYRGQARFVERRCGWAAGLVYRVAVTCAVLLRVLCVSADRQRRPTLADVREALWTSPAAVSTKAA